MIWHEWSSLRKQARASRRLLAVGTLPGPDLGPQPGQWSGIVCGSFLTVDFLQRFEKLWRWLRKVVGREWMAAPLRLANQCFLHQFIGTCLKLRTLTWSQGKRRLASPFDKRPIEWKWEDLNVAQCKDTPHDQQHVNKLHLHSSGFCLFSNSVSRTDRAYVTEQLLVVFDPRPESWTRQMTFLFFFRVQELANVIPYIGSLRLTFILSRIWPRRYRYL